MISDARREEIESAVVEEFVERLRGRASSSDASDSLLEGIEYYDDGRYLDTKIYVGLSAHELHERFGDDVYEVFPGLYREAV